MGFKVLKMMDTPSVVLPEVLLPRGTLY